MLGIDVCEALTCDLSTLPGGDLRSSEPPLHSQVLSGHRTCSLHQVHSMILCSAAGPSPGPCHISQSVFYSQPAPELPKICVKIQVNEPHSKDPQKFKYYQALAGDILHLILEIAEK